MQLTVNGVPIDATGSAPSQTLLRFLRTRAGLPGTKEGCASGDCGACTVLLAGPGEAPRAVNSCITLLGSVAGETVVTVEGLAGSEGPGRHPVQAAMVDCHGSQCGFCTPGFVMSLAGLYAADGRGDDAIREAIAGNLCRCTGYRPILEAGRRMYDYPPAPVVPECGALAAGLNHSGALPAGYHRPRDEAALQRLLREYPKAWLVAGGTDAVLELTQRYAAPDPVLDLSAVAELCTIDDGTDALRLGAAVPYSRLEQLFATLSPPLVAMLERLGSRQIRNRGTLGGNLANGSPIADMPPVLLAWDATVELAGADGGRRSIPVAAFHRGYRDTVLAPGEYVAAVTIPRAALARPHRIFKLSKRFEDDISTVLLAVSMEREGERLGAARVAYGGMAATPLRAAAVEEILTGATLDDATIERACAAATAVFTPIDDVRASAAYRRAMAAALLRRALRELREGVDLDIDAVEALHA
ncbi:xanthine dehydrogenase small subunit [Pseudohaliea rubra]|uniref:Xanthine dehydrogenase iron-sulfur subunit n=1 Tax=Pseudohaliea rubra DSM 19751 TaxID=1265313 RepID=A0A095VQP2_9GAMM|nr:FAD binding domain-containing protein [Pseudohaliea rubra]KGE03680.1 Xanthine dehydrogenase iron-sulfur subunit [Pseudohaliea rubra DSM 19751]